MKLMMVCPTCEGEGYLDYEALNRLMLSSAKKECDDCHGTGVIDPSQQILDDLECAEIERELLEKVFEYSYKYDSFSKDHMIKLKISEKHVVSMGFSYETKLEALRKAKYWMDGRGAE